MSRLFYSWLLLAMVSVGFGEVREAQAESRVGGSVGSDREDQALSIPGVVAARGRSNAVAGVRG